MGDRSLPAAAADRDWTRLRGHGGFAICAFLGENAGANGVSGGQLDLRETRFPSAVSNIRLSKITDEEQLSAPLPACVFYAGTIGFMACRR